MRIPLYLRWLIYVLGTDPPLVFLKEGVQCDRGVWVLPSSRYQNQSNGALFYDIGYNVGCALFTAMEGLWVLVWTVMDFDLHGTGEQRMTLCMLPLRYQFILLTKPHFLVVPNLHWTDHSSFVSYPYHKMQRFL